MSGPIFEVERPPRRPKPLSQSHHHIHNREIKEITLLLTQIKNLGLQFQKAYNVPGQRQFLPRPLTRYEHILIQKALKAYPKYTAGTKKGIDYDSIVGP